MLPSTVRPRFPVAVLLARLLVGLALAVYFVDQSPHLVHHLFEPTKVQNDCPFATAAERHQGAAAGVAAFVPAETPAAAVAPDVDHPILSAPRGSVEARAPPTAS